MFARFDRDGRFISFFEEQTRVSRVAPIRKKILVSRAQGFYLSCDRSRHSHLFGFVGRFFPRPPFGLSALNLSTSFFATILNLWTGLSTELEYLRRESINFLLRQIDEVCRDAGFSCNELGWTDYRLTDYPSIERWWSLVFSAYFLVSIHANNFSDLLAAVPPK